MLLNLKESLIAAADDKPIAVDDNDEEEDDASSRPTPSVIRIAAHASVLLINKYLDTLWDCELYVISISKPIYFKSLELDVFK